MVRLKSNQSTGCTGYWRHCHSELDSESAITRRIRSNQASSKRPPHGCSVRPRLNRFHHNS